MCVCLCELQGEGRKWPVDTAQEREREAKKPGQREERELVARATERELAEFRLYLLECLMEEAIMKVVQV